MCGNPLCIWRKTLMWHLCLLGNGRQFAQRGEHAPIRDNNYGTIWSSSLASPMWHTLCVRWTQSDYWEKPSLIPDQDHVTSTTVKCQEDCLKLSPKFTMGVHHGNNGANGHLVSLFKANQDLVTTCYTQCSPRETVDPSYINLPSEFRM